MENLGLTNIAFRHTFDKKNSKQIGNNAKIKNQNDQAFKCEF